MSQVSDDKSGVRGVNLKFDYADKIFILGAGSSVDYGLPVWKDLKEMIEDKLSGATGDEFNYKNQILSWIAKVGVGLEYETLDECISKESVSSEYKEGGHYIENEIFFILKIVFEEVYSREIRSSWIRILNNYILYSTPDVVKNMVFINYNYDEVFCDNILTFDYLSDKERFVTFDNELGSLSDFHVDVIYPHGNFFDIGRGSGYKTRSKVFTPKSQNGHKHGLIDVVSCYDSYKNAISFSNPFGVTLYILGLGGGLELNLNKISFDMTLMAVHVTIKDKSKRDDVVAFLTKRFSLSESEVIVYDSCEALIKACFPLQS